MSTKINFKGAYKNRKCTDMIIISQDNQFYHLFQLALTLICTFSSFLYAFYAAYRLDVEYETIDEYLEQNFAYAFTREEIRFHDYMFYAFEGIYFIDFLMQFLLEYQT